MKSRKMNPIVLVFLLHLQLYRLANKQYKNKGIWNVEWLDDIEQLKKTDSEVSWVSSDPPGLGQPSVLPPTFRAPVTGSPVNAMPCFVGTGYGGQASWKMDGDGVNSNRAVREYHGSRWFGKYNHATVLGRRNAFSLASQMIRPTMKVVLCYFN